MRKHAAEEIAWYVLAKLAEADPEIKDRVRNAARRGKWEVPSDAVLDQMFPPGWEASTNGSWQEQMLKSEWVKHQTSRRADAKRYGEPSEGSRQQSRYRTTSDYNSHSAYNDHDAWRKKKWEADDAWRKKKWEADDARDADNKKWWNDFDAREARRKADEAASKQKRQASADWWAEFNRARDAAWAKHDAAFAREEAAREAARVARQARQRWTNRALGAVGLAMAASLIGRGVYNAYTSDNKSKTQKSK